MKRKSLVAIILAVTALTAVAISHYRQNIKDVWNYRNDAAYTEIQAHTTAQGSLNILGKGKRKLTVNSGDSIYISNSGSDFDGIKRTRLYVNDFLLRDYKLKPSEDGSYPQHIADAWNIRTTEPGFRVGENILKYEVSATNDKVTTSIAKVCIR